MSAGRAGHAVEYDLIDTRRGWILAAAVIGAATFPYIEATSTRTLPPMWIGVHVRVPILRDSAPAQLDYESVPNNGIPREEAWMGKLYWLSAAEWFRLEPLLPRGRKGAHRVDDRRVISGIVHMLRSGARWRD